MSYYLTGSEHNVGFPIPNNKMTSTTGELKFFPSGTLDNGIARGGTTSSFVISASVVSASNGLIHSGSGMSGSYITMTDAAGTMTTLVFVSSSIWPGSGSMPPSFVWNKRRSHKWFTMSFAPGDQSDKAKFALQLQEEISHSLIAPVEAHPSFSISPFSSSIDADSNVIIFSQKTGSVRVRWNPELTASYGFEINYVDTGSGTYDGDGIQTGIIPMTTEPSYTLGLESGSSSTNFVITGSGTNKFYMSSSGLIGINTTDPKRAFDVRDETEGIAELAIKKNPKGSEETRGWQVGDDIGKLVFIADSSSYAHEISGSSTEIKSYIGSIDAGGVSGRMDFLSYKGVDPTPLTLMQMGYGAVASHAGNSGINIQANISQALASSANTSNVLVPTFFDGSITSSADVTIDGTFYGGNIGEIYSNYIYLTPADFYASNRADYTRTAKGFIDDDGANIEDGGGRDKYYAMKVIPKGYKATHAYVHSNNPAGDTYEVFSSSYAAFTSNDVVGSTTATNAVATFSNDITGGGGVYCTIAWNAQISKKLYGGWILLDKA